MKLRRSVSAGRLDEAQALARRLMGTTTGYGLEYSARGWAVVMLTSDSVDRRFIPTDGESTPFETSYFADGCYVHWMRAGDSGRITVQIDDSHAAFDGEPGTVVEVREVIEQRYMCWGEVESGDGVWAQLFDARVGWYALPVSSNSGRVVLEAREYVVVGIDGNSEVVAECPVAFRGEGS